MACLVIVLAGASISFAALTLSGTGITGSSNSTIDATGTISIGASSATGIMIGNPNANINIAGPIMISPTSTFGVQLANPTALPTLTATTSFNGTLPSNTIYYFKCAASDGVGVTLSTAEATGTTLGVATSGIQVTCPPVTSASGYDLYFATSSSAEASYFNNSSNIINFATTTGAVAGAPSAIDSAYAVVLNRNGNTYFGGNVIIGSPSSTLTISGLASTSTQCLQVNASGTVSGTGFGCGSGGSSSSVTVAPPVTTGNFALWTNSSSLSGTSTLSQASNGAINASGTIYQNGSYVGNTNGTILRRAMWSAAEGNPMTLPTLLPALAWASSTQYNMGDTISSGGYLFVNHTAGVSGSTMPSFSATTTPFADGADTWYFYGLAPATSTWSSGITLTNTTTAPSDLSNVYLATSPVFQYLGGRPTIITGSTITLNQDMVPSGTGNCASSNAFECTTGSVSFMTDAPRIAVGLYGNNPIRFVVDNQFLSPTDYEATSSASPSYEVFDFTNAGGAKPRKITLMQYASNTFKQVRVGPTYKVWAPDPSNNITVAVVGDSITAGGNSFPSGAGFLWPDMLGYMMGWNNVWNLGLGGTGFIATSTTYNFIQRDADVVAANPNLLIILGGINDEVFGSSSQQAAILTYLQTIRGLEPKMPIVVLGAWPAIVSTNSARIATENALSSAVAQFNDANTYFIPDITDPSGSWLTGSGKVTAKNASGNTDNYISSDGTHPTDFGIYYFSQRVFNALKTVINEIP